MTKYLFGLFFLFASLNIHATQSLVDILYNQCESLSAIDISNSSDLVTKQRHFELQSLAINNISDSLNYLRQFPLNSDTTEQLVRCQMNLSNVWESFLESSSAKLFIQELKASDNKHFHTLAKQLTSSKTHFLPESQLTKLRTMEAIFRSNLSSKASSIHVSKPQCYLNSDNTFGGDNDISVARYLINHPNKACRKAVWTRYYDRPYLQKALNEIRNIRQQQAKAQGYADYTHFVLSDNYLNSPDLVNQYLTGITQKFVAEPWNIGFKLKQLKSPPAKTTHQQGHELVIKALNELKPFGINYDDIDNQVVRLWYNKHLLGDINVIYQEKGKQAAEIIRFPVLGYQFGQARLFLNKQLTSVKQKKQLINQLSVVLSVFFNTSRNYLTNGLINNNDHKLIAQFWIADLLTNKTIKTRTSATNRLASQYLRQLKVARAKATLDFYKKDKSSHNKFWLAENKPFAEFDNYLYGFSGMVEQGPNYFAELWQRDLASYLLQYATEQNKLELFFQLFIIDEQNHSFDNNLSLLFENQITRSELVRSVIKSCPQ